MLPSRHLTASCSSALTKAFGASRAPGKTTVSNHSHSHSTLVAATAKGGVQLDIANSVWPQREDGFRQDFLDLLKTDYGAMVTPSRRAGTIDFLADHPFLVLVQQADTGTILFMGRVADPQGSAKL